MKSFKFNVTNNNQIIIHHENRLWFKLYILKTNGRSKTFSESRRARTRSETTSVLLYYIYVYLKTMCIFNVYNMKIQKTIYIEPTLVLTRVCPTWTTSCRHPNHSSRAINSHTASVEWKITSPHMRPLT